MAVLHALAASPFARMLLLGLVVFVVGGFGPDAETDAILVTSPQVKAALDEHRARSGRAPTPTEEQAIVQDLADGELLVHHALVLGLDRDDVVIRRRMRQKMEALLQHLAPPREPTDADLEALRDAHPDRWVRPDRWTVDHVFAAGDGAEATAVALATQLRAGTDPTTLGDPPPGGRQFVDRTEAQIAATLGATAAAQIRGIAVGEWSAPLRSARGWHLVRVVERRSAPLPAVSEIRGALLEDWATAERTAGLGQAIRDVVSRYVVTTE